MTALNLLFDDTGTDVQLEQKPHDRVRDALKAGQLSEVMNILDGLCKYELMETVLRAGFGLAGTKTKQEIYTHLQPQLVQAAKLKMDGYELRDYKKAGMS